ncbi:HsdM family class I SAM-dependent methyltransferase [Mycoplasmopsis verecunda]|uniref:site-specific DNA-methyltransferase (adenine-specific) n=1 Tax=Mycoplasmopsis verecunda TaxID=171291 RepID=A0A1T4M7X7_9BACT|nr:N-6 DNA methylase [Mycoplasmopsis verecunda]WPB54373.1 N-6 DNA methylase [Mycoplasmopsis verecunda]SJZ63113.1 Type I restriction-modification system, DNA methylase subunit [Mycoplasmopsis verecunda]
MEYYRDLFQNKKNEKELVMKNTYELNELLHKYGIREDLRSQFIGTCLLALKSGLMYDERMETSQIISGIEDKLSILLKDTFNKAEKVIILNKKVLDIQDIKSLESKNLINILNFVKEKILPFINDRSKAGQDILNLFFTTFNKYVGKKDKNQAFTPDHIVHFMSQICEINRNSRVLDPCCGSGAFLVRAMVDAINDCENDQCIANIKKEQIYGIEYEEKAFGLATTNMLIHGDGNSNIYQKNCFDVSDDEWKKWDINVVLMNPPYNAQKKHSYPIYAKTWDSNKKQDPSKGFHFVEFIASKVNKGIMAVLLPTACAIGGKNKDILKYKKKMLENHTLKAVFSLPQEIFYPGASASACCMVFELGKPHKSRKIKETFFGYYKDDGFTKKKNIGRVEKIIDGKSAWDSIEKEWLDLYFRNEEVPGLSIIKEVDYNDEWLAEAYMETDYSKLTENDFIKTIRDFISFKIKNGELDE